MSRIYFAHPHIRNLVSKKFRGTSNTRATAAYTISDGYLRVGLAYTSPEDNFFKVRGRGLATSRLQKGSYFEFPLEDNYTNSQVNALVAECVARSAPSYWLSFEVVGLTPEPLTAAIDKSAKLSNAWDDAFNKLNEDYQVLEDSFQAAASTIVPSVRFE
jgi:hypothetical protein